MRRKFPFSVTLLTAIFTSSFVVSCGGGSEVTPAANLSYVTSSGAKPNCACKNKNPGVIEPSPDITATPSPVVSATPSSAVSPDSGTGLDGENLPEIPSSPSASTPPTETPKKKTLVGQWLEKIGNLFKKKKTT